MLVPVKALTWGKSRLSSLLSESARQAVSQAMLADVLTSLRQASTVDRIVAVSSEPSLLEFARQLGACTIDEEYPRGINGAVEVGTEFCVRQGATALLVLLADLPLVTAEDVDFLFQQTSGNPEVILVPCKEGEGTNALLRVPPLIMAPCFGGGPSLARHLVMARCEGIPCRVVEVPRIAFDLDSAADLQRFAAQPTRTHTYKALQEYGICLGAPGK
ncbi:MAG TPA: 2-phospho-L-lactate guanylyltransferase [Candidatus Binatia bacterium]|nr:2-phospho-L-lactate guanylyltransferase [Candidatus Binatia bacterium]